MRQLDTIAQLKAARAHANGRVALVPTMGNLHEGHLSLVRLAKQHAEQVMVTIFVNPLQFSPGEDLARYPRTLATDLAVLDKEGVDWVFTPDEAELYPHGRDAQTQVLVPDISHLLCGATRPNFFGGIATVVSKLLILVRPDVAIFGQKDYQQFLVIQRMVQDLHIDVELVMAPIVREADGLAMSSRNGYLGEQERAIAPRLYQSLQVIAQAGTGQAVADALAEQRARLAQDFAVDYLTCRRAHDLAECEDGYQGDRVVLAAVMLGSTRLIDNILCPFAK